VFYFRSFSLFLELIKIEPVTAELSKVARFVKHAQLGPKTRGTRLKTLQIFFIHTTPEEFEKATITGHFGFVFEDNSGREVT